MSIIVNEFVILERKTTYRINELIICSKTAIKRETGRWMKIKFDLTVNENAIEITTDAPNEFNFFFSLNYKKRKNNKKPHDMTV